MNYQEWDQLSYDKYALTIKDILNLKRGEQITVLTMDRNVWDCLTDCVKGQSYKPTELLADSWAIYTHEENLRGKLLFWFECDSSLEKTRSAQLGLSENGGSKGGLCPPRNFEFHIEYKKGSWYPLENGYLPDSDPQGFSDFPWVEKQHWNSFPE